MDDKELEIERLRQELDDAKYINSQLEDEIRDLKNKLSEVSDAVYGIYRSI